MPQSCTVCRNPERFAIDAALVQNESLRHIAKHFRTTPASLYRHRKHLPLELTQAKQAQDVACATTLLDRVQSLMARLESIAEQAQKDRAWAAAVGAVREVRNCLTLLGQLSGELQTGMRSSINLAEALQQIRMAARTASPKQYAELLEFTKELFDNATDEQFVAAAQAQGIDLPGLESSAAIT